MEGGVAVLMCNWINGAGSGRQRGRCSASSPQFYIWCGPDWTAQPGGGGAQFLGSCLRSSAITSCFLSRPLHLSTKSLLAQPSDHLWLQAVNTGSCGFWFPTGQEGSFLP